MPKVIELASVQTEKNNPDLQDEVNSDLRNEVIVMERRRAHRYSVNLPCLVKIAFGHKGTVDSPLFLAETINASRSGFFFSTRPDPELRMGTEIECIIQLPLEFNRLVSIRCWGQIVRVVAGEDGRIGVGADIEHFCLPAAIPKVVKKKRRQRAGLAISFRKRHLRHMSN